MGDFQVSSPGEQRSGQRSRGRRTDLPNVRLLLWVGGGGGPGPEQVHTDSLFSAGEKCGEWRTRGRPAGDSGLKSGPVPFPGLEKPGEES